MMRISEHLRLLSAAALLATAVSTVHADANAPRRELRSAWVTTAWHLDWPSTTNNEDTQKTEATTILDNLKAMGANCVYFQVRSMNDRYYNKNSYTIGGTTYTISGEGRSQYLAGTWDSLQFWLDEAHKRGMELYAWINPYRVATSQSEYDRQNLSSTMKSWIIKSKSLRSGATDESENPYNDIWIYNPALTQTKTRIRNVCLVLAGNYDIDGIVFDDYFYPDRIKVDDNAGASPDQAQYNDYVNDGGKLSKADWRRNNINDMVAIVNEAVHSVKPWVKFGISPAGVAYKGLDNFDDETATARPSAYGVTTDDWQYNDIFSDPVNWVHERIIDFISPQIYWQYNDVPPFKGCCEWWTRYAKRHDVHFYASHSVSYVYFASTKYDGEAGYAYEKRKVDCVRKEGTEN
ncbi:MAG: glycoside hydrolase family 10 protein, partial [Muribaculaceae bacterium]